MAVLSAMCSLAASRQAVPGGGSHFGGPRFAQTPLRCSIRRVAPQNSLRAARCALTAAASSVTKRAKARRPCESVLLAASEIAPTGHRLPRSRVQVRHRWCANIASAKPACRAHRPGGASGTPSSARVSVGARSALRALTRRSCLSGARKARAASSSARPNPEQHRGVAAGDRSSEAPRAVCPAGRLCREVHRTKHKASKNI
jgi:hypothetical protein